jgi:hypothetical protein
MFRILQGATGIIFGVAIAIKRGTFPRWVGGIGIFAGMLTMNDGISVAYIGFAVSCLAATYELTYAIWTVIMGIYVEENHDKAGYTLTRPTIKNHDKAGYTLTRPTIKE